jgi:hypothetical protein
MMIDVVVTASITRYIKLSGSSGKILCVMSLDVLMVKI